MPHQDGPPPLPADHGKPSRKRLTWRVVLVGLGLLVAGLVWVVARPLTPARGAWIICTQFVRDRLAASSSRATFPAYDAHNVDTLNAQPSHYRVHGTVDATTARGVTIHTAYTCTVEPRGGDRWRLHALTFDE